MCVGGIGFSVGGHGHVCKVLRWWFRFVVLRYAYVWSWGIRVVGVKGGRVGSGKPRCMHSKKNGFWSFKLESVRGLDVLEL